jgi:D-alanine-D-alanine ligase-like ATP-grasp enzyme
MKAAGPKLNPNKRRYCFEVFGYDFIIDADMKMWLIEVNTNPCLDESSSLLKRLIP